MDIDKSAKWVGLNKAQVTFDVNSVRKLMKIIKILYWSFYAQYNNGKPPVEIVETPDTMSNSFPYTIAFSIIIVLVGLGIIINARKKQS